MPSSKRKGFTIIELLVSVAILGVLASASYASLTRARYQDELYNAARVLANDLRSAQLAALNSTNVPFCPVGGVLQKVCIYDSIGCTGACTPQPPAVTGVNFYVGSNNYNLYAKSDVSSGDSRRSSTVFERTAKRDFSTLGAPNVTIQAVTATSVAGVPFTVDPMDVAFARQSGTMQINVCASGCTAANELTVVLAHSVTGGTVRVKMNAVTGRIGSDL